MSRPLLIVALVVVLTAPVAAAPVPKGPLSALPGFSTPDRNRANFTDKLTKFPLKGPDWEDDEAVKKWSGEWVLWKAELGSWAYGGPVVAGGRVYVGTNNERPRNIRDTRKNARNVEPIDKGVLMCFDQKTGAFLWQAVHDKLPGGIANDWPMIGITASPTVVADRLYYVSNRCTVVCADVNGFANGNQGFEDEKHKELTDADIIWEFDMILELKVFPHSCSNCSPLVVGDRLFVCTSNGVDNTHVNIPSPDAPTLICLDRHTGKLLWKDNSPGKNIMHGQWSNPAYAADPVPQVIHGQGDGSLRAFDPDTGKLLWQFDGNRKGAKWELGGTGDKNNFVAAPVVVGGRVYIGTGDCPENSLGVAHLWCIDLKKAVELGAKSPGRDVSRESVVRVEKRPDGGEKVVTKPNPASAVVWCYGGAESRKWAPREFIFGRTLSTVAVVGDIVYAAEFGGYIHCLNARTGQLYWQYDTKASIWGSPLYVDGKVLVATDQGDLFVFRHEAKPEVIDDIEAAKGAPDQKTARAIYKAERARLEKKYLLAKVELDGPVRGSPTVANGVLYIVTDRSLFAIRGTDR